VDSSKLFSSRLPDGHEKVLQKGLFAMDLKVYEGVVEDVRRAYGATVHFSTSLENSTKLHPKLMFEVFVISLIVAN
jgi:hypothetical protein